MATNFAVGLWVTDGTAAGTYEITGPGGPYGFTNFNGEVLFGSGGLWITDGTAAGTHELIPASGEPSVGLGPGYMTVLNGEVLFQGRESLSDIGLWVTDGTGAGTHEITGISGAYTGQGGLSPWGLTALNGEVLFSGRDMNGGYGLWVTDGTANGTHELSGISGANGAGLNPSDLTAFNGHVLFTATDANGFRAVWLTDGTPGGTHEIAAVAGSNFSVVGGKVLFLILRRAALRVCG